MAHILIFQFNSYGEFGGQGILRTCAYIEKELVGGS